MARNCAYQKPSEEKPRENTNSSGCGYICHAEADEQMHQIHEDDGIGGLQKRSHSTYDRDDAKTPKKHILNTTTQQRTKK